MKFISILFLLLFSQTIFLSFAQPKYNLYFEYLLSDEKEIFEIELYNKPQNNLLDFGEDIFYSGQIESIDKYPIAKLINFNKTEFMMEQKKKEEEFFFGKKKGKNEGNERKRMEKKENYQSENKKIQENEESLFEDPFFRFFYNDYDPFENLKRYKNTEHNNYYDYDISKRNNNQNKNHYYSNKYNIDNNYNNNNNYNSKDSNYFNHNNNYNYNNKRNHYYNNNNKDYNYYYNKNKNNEKYNNQFNNNNIQIIHDGNGHTIKIIKFPKSNTFQKNNDYNNNNYNYNNNNYDNNNNNKNNRIYNKDPFSVFDEFDFDDPFKFLESTLNNIYGIRILSENNKNKLNSKLFSTQKHHLLFIPNKSYFDYIKYLPKSTILLIPKQYAKQIPNYEDFYIFTVEEKLSLISSMSKTENHYHQVKIGQNFNDSNFIFISISVTIFLCLIGSIIYSVLLKNTDSIDILPVQRLVSKFPIFLGFLNLLIYFSYVFSYQESDGFYIIMKYVFLFLNSIFRSIFLSVLTLLLNGWMTLSFIGWAEKLNRVLSFLIYELISSIFFEIIGFYDILPYNKLQLYYFRNIFENIIIASISFISIFKYYYPLNQKCKYLSLINSDFNEAYQLKKRKMLSFTIFGLFYAFISIYSNYFEFSLISKYIQNDILHIIKQIIFESIFNFILIIILLPMELPNLFTEETDLLSFGYFFTNLNEKNEILDINDENIKDIKKEAQENEDFPIVIVNPFYNSKNGFDELHTGKLSME